MLEHVNNLAQKITNCDASNCLSDFPEIKANENQLQNLLGIFFGVIGAVAVIVIILAAIGLATSEGNPENISKSKKTIIYAAVGLAIALSAEFIVFNVVGRL